MKGRVNLINAANQVVYGKKSPELSPRSIGSEPFWASRKVVNSNPYYQQYNQQSSRKGSADGNGDINGGGTPPYMMNKSSSLGAADLRLRVDDIPGA